jgi:hypothetical protein
MIRSRTNKKKKESPMHRFFGMTSVAAIAGALMLAGCQSDDIERAQATANHAVADAANARMAADVADQKATQAGQMAAQAQSTANTAQGLAQNANSNSQQALAAANAAQSLAQAHIAASAPRVARGERD